MELGVAGTIGLKEFAYDVDAVKWLNENQDIEIIDIKYSPADEYSNILIIYRKEDSNDECEDQRLVGFNV